MEYTIHPEGGIKYALIVHPGADASQVQMCYDDDRELRINEKGQLRVNSLFGDLIEHAPHTYYANGKDAIPSSFQLDGHIVSFDLEQYDTSKKNSKLTPGCK